MDEYRKIRSVLILHNDDIYKEVGLDDYEEEIIAIGNTDECQVNLKTIYDKEFNVIFTRKKTVGKFQMEKIHIVLLMELKFLEK